ncbi:hypothetical protein L4174_014715 [Photobacterium sp. CCB-ST2H9]|uniref:hypothetical protein n=1 Tax=Photobacterium sp. CCB-ST2H9 TaxID=2912855 RepID=UPI0020C6465A|nr:hypothetical protein [Photobacterium sp. CCB-ST2H9]UTM57033.1 hypothetical protein L4174_014715 [Photobacterium sp. CCB-ST2H9]
MSKNPTRGYIRCTVPDCGEVCTVHMTGEHRLMESGEPPKNPRNIGKLYYRCPRCGNSTNSSAMHEYIEKHKVETVQELGVAPIETVRETTKESVQTVIETHPVSVSQTSDDGFPALTEPETEPEKNTPKIHWKTLYPWFIGLFVLVMILIGLSKGKKDDSDSGKLATN